MYTRWHASRPGRAGLLPGPIATAFHPAVEARILRVDRADQQLAVQLHGGARLRSAADGPSEASSTRALDVVEASFEETRTHPPPSSRHAAGDRDEDEAAPRHRPCRGGR